MPCRMAEFGARKIWKSGLGGGREISTLMDVGNWSEESQWAAGHLELSDESVTVGTVSGTVQKVCHMCAEVLSMLCSVAGHLS